MRRSGLAVLLLLLLLDVVAGAAHPLSVEPDRARHVSDWFAVLVDGLQHSFGEFQAQAFFVLQCGTVLPAESAQVGVAVVCHVPMVPHVVRHHLIASPHGYQCRTRCATLSRTSCATGCGMMCRASPRGREGDTHSVMPAGLRA